ncbi:MAG: FAD-dependent monooxygenase [Kofleriaceae bacterium]|nr:FAD-dependent monooxygenase [Kofleriaceae bacterium]
MSAHRVAVVGCGTAGAAAALLLARAGHDVTVFERVAAPGPVGAGITLQPTGQAVLARLGLLGPIAADGARIDRLICRTARRKVVVDLPYRAVDPDLHGIGLHRGLLFETLFAAVGAEPGVTLRCGVGVAAMPRDGATRTLVTDDGARLGPYDLIVVADGSVSELHDDTTIRTRVRPYPWGALWFVAEDRDRVFDGELVQWVEGARRMCGFLPTGRAPRGAAPVVSLFWSLRADRLDAWRAAGLAPWKREVLRYEPRAGFVLDQIRDPAQVLFARYRDVTMRGWHEPGAVFIGDAAHATSPQLGQGANLALWDAMVLADCVAGHAAVDAALAAYTAARRRHLGYYQFATRALTPFFQGDSRLRGWLRDLLFPTSRWLRPLRRRMVRTMIGVDRGVVRRPIPLAELRGLLAAPRG